MDKADSEPAQFPYTDEQLKQAGLLDDDVSQSVKHTLELMRKHPDLLNHSLFALQCLNEHTKKEERDRLAAESAKVDISKLSTVTDGGSYSISEYERATYYAGISPNPPPLLYRSDLLSNPFPLPPRVLTKTMHGVFDTPLNAVWSTVGPQIRDLVKERGIRYSAINVGRHVTKDDEGNSTRGPVIIWIMVHPDSTTSEEAYQASEGILGILKNSGIEDVVVEWTEGVVRRL